MAAHSPYRIIAIERTDRPKHAQGGEWYHYVIANSYNRVAGHRCGSRRQVRLHVEEFAEQLNTRSRNGQSMWAPRGRKPNQQKLAEKAAQ